MSTSICLDCHIDTVQIGDYYMVHKYIWSQTGLGMDDGMLCLNCLERHIGRKLSFKDFTGAPINDPIVWAKIADASWLVSLKDLGPNMYPFE